MQTAYSEPAKNDPNCEMRLGIASWDDGTNTAKSFKYTWFDKNGKAARGGEIPVDALPQALEFAIRSGYLHLRSNEAEQMTAYHFDSYGTGLQDAFVYYHRDFTSAELEAVSATLSALLRRKHRGTAVLFVLESVSFPEALESLKKQIGEQMSDPAAPKA